MAKDEDLASEEQEIREQLAELDEDEKEEQMEEDQELMDDLRDEDIDGYGSPNAEEDHNRIKFLKEAREAEDTTRSTLLTKGELGIPLFSVRFYLAQVLKAKLAGFDILADHLRNKSFVTSDTGLSRDGFLMGLAVTKRKETNKKRSVRGVNEPKQ